MIQGILPMPESAALIGIWDRGYRFRPAGPSGNRRLSYWQLVWWLVLPGPSLLGPGLPCGSPRQAGFHSVNCCLSAASEPWSHCQAVRW